MFVNYLDILVDSIVLCCCIYVKNIFHFFSHVVIIHGKSIRDAVTSTNFFSKTSELHLSTKSKNNVASYSN